MINIEAFKKFVQQKWKMIMVVMVSIIGLLIIVLVNQNLKTKGTEVEEEADIYEELILNEQIKEDPVIVEENQSKEEEPLIELVVDVKGAVTEPGVYKMKTNSRIIDAIEKAGGLLENAEQKAVNLAQIVEDQMVIYVPEVGEEGFEAGQLMPTSSQGKDVQNKELDKVNINTADKESLMTLSGIGQSKADKILSYREEKGLFQSIEEIKNVSGIGEATFENLKDRIIVSP